MSFIKSAGCLIIGDEVLNGKILDTNSNYFAKYCFNTLKVPVKKTIVCGDDVTDIHLSLASLIDTDKCDFIVTSGGIGPTHDDITYNAISSYFKVDCKLHQPTVDRMRSLRSEYLQTLTHERLEAFYRMATFPQQSETVKVDHIYTNKSLWVPIVGINQQVFILPGVPQLFEQLLVSLGHSLQKRIDSKRSLVRYYVKTSTKESELAPFLTRLQNECDAKYGKNVVKLGSYPHFSWKINTISIIGNEVIDPQRLREIVGEIVDNIGGNAEEILMQQENVFSTTSPMIKNAKHLN